MTDRRLTILDMVTILIVTALAAIALWIAVAGPTEPLPMHFDVHGQPNRWGDRNELAGTMGFMALMAAITAGPMGWFAKRAPDLSRRRGLVFGQLVSLLAIGGVSVFMLWSILGFELTGATVSAGAGMALMGVLFAVIGGFLGRVGPNPVVGVRTPWSYKSRLAWDRSNRLAGRLLFWLGVAAVLAAPLAPQPAGMTVVIVGVLIAAAWSVFESWRVWRDDPDRQPF